MPTPFAALEARVNAVALAKCANATAIVVGQDEPVDGIFDAEYIDALDVNSVRPSFLAPAASLAAAVRDTAVTIDCTPLALVAAAYTVVERRREHGMMRLFLQQAGS